MSKIYVAVQRSGQKQNELTHWKYIKREKKNGKWRYYYDRDSLKADVKDKLGYDERDRYEAAKKRHEDAVEKTDNAYDTFRNEMVRKDRNPFEANSYSKHIYNMSTIAMNNLHKASSNERAALIELTNARNKYDKTPLSKIDKLTNKIEDAKNWLKKKLGIH